MASQHPDPKLLSAPWVDHGLGGVGKGWSRVDGRGAELLSCSHPSDAGPFPEDPNKMSPDLHLTLILIIFLFFVGY